MASLKDTVKDIAKDKDIKLPEHIISDLNQIDRDIEKQRKSEEKTMTAESILKDMRRERHFDDFDKNDWREIERYLEKVIR